MWIKGLDITPKYVENGRWITHKENPEDLPVWGAGPSFRDLGNFASCCGAVLPYRGYFVTESYSSGERIRNDPQIARAFALAVNAERQRLLAHILAKCCNEFAGLCPGTETIGFYTTFGHLLPLPVPFHGPRGVEASYQSNGYVVLYSRDKPLILNNKAYDRIMFPWNYIYDGVAGVPGAIDYVNGDLAGICNIMIQTRKMVFTTIEKRRWRRCLESYPMRVGRDTPRLMAAKGCSHEPAQQLMTEMFLVVVD